MSASVSDVWRGEAGRLQDCGQRKYRIQIHGREISGKQTESLNTSGGGRVSEHHIEIHTNRVRNRGPSFKTMPFELNIFWGKIIAAIKSRRVYLIPTIIIFFSWSGFYNHACKNHSIWSKEATGHHSHSLSAVKKWIDIGETEWILSLNSFMSKQKLIIDWY